MLKKGIELFGLNKLLLPNHINILADMNLLHLVPKLPKHTRPIQKYMLEAISYVNLPFYKNSITCEFISKLHSKMEPGDIVFTRAKWHMNNLGIPGFWKHNILFIGNLKKINEYFNKDLNINASEIIKQKYPEIYEIMSDENVENPFSVIEVKRQGVIMRSFEEACEVDYLATIRPNLSKQDKFEAILISMEHYNKPYDHDFDMNTDEALTCSELIYKSYEKSLVIELKKINGRVFICPDTIYKKFIKEMNLDDKQLEFVFSVNLSGNKLLDENVESFANSPKSII